MEYHNIISRSDGDSILMQLPFKPVPWAAHQGFGNRSYNPRDRERKIFRSYLKLIKAKEKWECVNEGICVSYLFFFLPPNSWTKKKKESALKNESFHCSKPDLTNLVKFTEDCLKGIFFKDDSSVTSCNAIKEYGYQEYIEIRCVKSSSFKV